MSSISTRKFGPPIVLLALGFLTLGFACTGTMSHASMHDPSVSATTTMPANSQECCNTGISKNIESWKSTLLVLPREIKDGLWLLLLGLTTFFAFTSWGFKHNPDDSHRPPYEFYIRDNPDLSLFNQLQLAFASGILNPKIY